MLGRIVVAAILSCALGTASMAANSTVTVTGCAMKGIEHGCIILRTVAGKTYNITAAMPAPKPGTYGTVHGSVFRGASPCQQGTILKPANWTLKGNLCPLTNK